MHAGAPSKTNGCPPRCSGGCGPSRSPRRGPRCGPCPPRRTRASCSTGRTWEPTAGERSRASTGSRRSSPSSRACSCPLHRGRARCCPPACAITARRCWTSCCPRATSCGSAAAAKAKRRGRTAAPRPPLRPASWRSTRRTRLLRPCRPTCPKTPPPSLRLRGTAASGALPPCPARRPAPGRLRRGPLPGPDRPSRAPSSMRWAAAAACSSARSWMPCAGGSRRSASTRQPSPARCGRLRGAV